MTIINLSTYEWVSHPVQWQSCHKSSLSCLTSWRRDPSQWRQSCLPLEPRSFLSTQRRSHLRDLPLKATHSSCCHREEKGKMSHREKLSLVHPELIGAGHFDLSNVAAHKLLVRSQQVELRSAEVPGFIWSAQLSPWVHPHADWTLFYAMRSLICIVYDSEVTKYC